jgi:hypothetical protein
MVAWRRVSAKAKLLAMLGTILVALAASWVVVPSLTSDEVAVAETTKRPDREAREVEAALQRQRLLDEMQEAERAHEEEFRRADEAAAKRQAELEAALVATPVKRRRIKSYRWEAPEDALARVWNIPNADAVEAEATALLRIFINEADGQELDSHGIWQVLRTIRSRSCDRSMRRRITDCEEYEHRGETRYRETLLSAMRRMSKAVVDENILQRTKRQRWTSQVELSCERPRNYPGNEKTWRFQYGVRCPRRAELARKLVSGQEDVNLVEGVTLIAWGGQCRPGQACDNRTACRRRLSLVETKTENGFWCRRGTKGCRVEIEPICYALGFRDGENNEVIELPQPPPEETQQEVSAAEGTESLTEEVRL